LSSCSLIYTMSLYMCTKMHTSLTPRCSPKSVKRPLWSRTSIQILLSDLIAKGLGKKIQAGGIQRELSSCEHLACFLVSKELPALVKADHSACAESIPPTWVYKNLPPSPSSSYLKFPSIAKAIPACRNTHSNCNLDDNS
jgi:hypothetical protein